jgi:two-component system, NtrC family, response regulator AtoC
MYIQKILIADDEPLMRNFLKETLLRKKFQVFLAEDGSQAISLIEKENFDLILSDIKMPKKTGIEVLRFAKNHSPHIPVILMTAFGSIENAVEAMKMGAFNYLIKPFSPESIETLIEKAEEQLLLVAENRYLKEHRKPSLIAESEPMKKLICDMEKIAKSHASVFISGESGTGKEVIAQAIHDLSLRNQKPFIKVNCAAIPETLIESEFFGHEKGAFTGANGKKEGRFELADGGTLLLDEVTEIPISLQPKLLRAIQEKEFERVGGTHSLHVDIRFISTSNRVMKRAIESNLFREDLFYRLNVVPIHVPPLRERSQDILALSHYFLDRFCLENHKPKKALSQEAQEKLLAYPWPGNVRELANIIERTVVLDFAPVIAGEHLFLDTSSSSVVSFFGCSLAEMEKKLILETLQKEKQNRSKAAKTLGISVRTLRNKIKEYALSSQATLFP